MNKLTSFQRKLIYLTGIILLLIGVHQLGAPAAPANPGAGNAQATGGGVLQQLRVEHDLGESSLGDVDPASQTMNLVLLGLRGVATSVLWMQAQDQQRTKDWARLEATTNSITLLQPHFLKVWTFQGWNLAFNVSVEWDQVDKRYFWVKRGIKFLMKGIDRNKKYSELYWYTGDTFGKKIGRADEWKQFRKYFKDDPDKVNYPEGLDREINPEGKDNYLVAREWFQRANDVNARPDAVQQHIQALILFRSYPMRALFDYATALQRDGIFDEVTRLAWLEGLSGWTKVYGMEPYDSDAGEVHLEASYNQRDLDDMLKDDRQKEERQQKLHWVHRFQDMTNYRYWRLRAEVEGEQNTVEAHRELYAGEQTFHKGDFTTAKRLLFDGMTRYEKMLEKYPDLQNEDDPIEEGLIGQLNWRACLELDDDPPPETLAKYPLKSLWTTRQDRLETVRQEFQRRKRQFR